MAHAEFTAVSAATAITYDSASIPTGWQKITIAEKGKALSEQLDKTHAGDATYQWMDDPLGAKGQVSCEVTVDGLWSVTDHQDTGLLTKAIDGAATLVVTTKALGDKFTLTSAAYKGLEAGAGFAEVQPFSAKFSNAGSTGTWSTAI